MLLLRRKAATNIPNRDGLSAFDLIDEESKNIFDAKSQELDRLASSKLYAVARMQGREDEGEGGCTVM